MKRVVVVNAPARLGVYGGLSELAAIEIPVWAGMIADYLTRHNHEAHVLDAGVAGWDVEQTAAQIRLFNPDLAVFPVYGQQPSASTQCLPAAEAVARALSGIHTLALGTHPSALPERTLYEGPWTYVVRGEGPLALKALLRQISNGSVRDQGGSWIVDVPGLYTKWHVHRPAPLNIDDLDAELPTRGFHRFDLARYRAHNWHTFGYSNRSPYVSLQTSLGCPWRCTFCSINAPFGASGIRFWSPANCAVQLVNLVRQYGFLHVKIPDEMFVLNRQHVWQFCNHLIDMGLAPHVNIWAYARVDTVKDEAMLAHMKKAGFNWLGIGIESASAHVRHGVEKGRFGRREIVEAVARVRKADIAVGANYIFGLPDDTRETMQETLDLACELNTEWANFYSAMAYPGSQLYGEAKRRGWLLPDDPGGPGWIGYAQHAYEALPLPTETLNGAEVLDFRDRAHLAYFSRAEYKVMLRRRFGDAAVADVDAMLAAGRPRRQLLENKEMTHEPV